MQNGYGYPNVARVWEKPIEEGVGYNLIIDDLDHTKLCTVDISSDGLGLYAIGASPSRRVAVYTVSDMTKLYEMVASQVPVMIGNLPLFVLTSGGTPIGLKGLVGVTNDVTEYPIGFFVNSGKMFAVDKDNNRSEIQTIMTQPIVQGTVQQLGVNQVSRLLACYVQIFSTSYQGDCREFEDVPEETQRLFDIETGVFS